MRREGELSIREAAGKLEVHEDTVRAWCQAAIAGTKSRLGGAVRRDLVGYYWIREKHVDELVDQAKRGLAEYT